MKKFIALLSFIALFTSCEQPKNEEKIHENAEGEITIGKNLVVDRPMAIIVSPTDEQLKEAKKEFGEDYQIFYGDGAHFINEANKILEENKIETIDRLSNEIITFSTVDGKLYDVNLTEKQFAVLLFNGKEEPKDLEMEEFTTEFIQSYMN
jgi:hypothetical protein